MAASSEVFYEVFIVISGSVRAAINVNTRPLPGSQPARYRTVSGETGELSGGSLTVPARVSNQVNA
jgi:hypothetical protein